MTDLRVPCCAPYKTPGFSVRDEMVTLKAGRGEDEKDFEVHAVLLREASGYFAEKLSEKTIFFFPDDHPALIKAFVSFLYDGSFHCSKHLPFRHLIDLFAFANDIDAPSVRNAALDDFFLRIYADPDDIPYEKIRQIYESTSTHSSLRDLMVDAVVHVGEKREVEEWGERLPKLFLVNCLSAASEDGVAPFDGTGARAWLEEKKDRLCREYHLHSDDGMEDEMVEASEQPDEDSEKVETQYYPFEEFKHTWVRY